MKTCTLPANSSSNKKSLRERVANSNERAFRKCETAKKGILTDLLGKEVSLLQNELSQLVVIKDFQSKQAYTSHFLDENIKDLQLTNENVAQKALILEENNTLLNNSNKILIQQLDKYESLTNRLKSQIKNSELSLLTQRNAQSILEGRASYDEESIKCAIAKQEALRSEINYQGSQKMLFESQIMAAKAEIRKLETKLSESTTHGIDLVQKETSLTESNKKITCELQAIDSRLCEMRNRNDFLKSEVEELSQSLSQKELKNQNLLAQKQHLQGLSEDFNRLRIAYSEKLNDKILARNIIIKKIMDDNGRLEALGNDAEQTLKTLKTLL
jgi:hypothetical protein